VEGKWKRVRATSGNCLEGKDMVSAPVLYVFFFFYSWFGCAPRARLPVLALDLDSWRSTILPLLN